MKKQLITTLLGLSLGSLAYASASQTLQVKNGGDQTLTFGATPVSFAWSTGSGGTAPTINQGTCANASLTHNQTCSFTLTAQPDANITETQQGVATITSTNTPVKTFALTVNVEPVPVFVNNDNGTMTQTGTNLMWIQDADTINGGNTLNWQTGIDTCEAMTTGGYNDWRLPTKDELEAIVNLKDAETGNKGDVGSWLNGEGFANIQNAWYWTSTDAPLTGLAWDVNFVGGSVGNLGKTNGRNDRAWCVRSGL